MKIIWLKGLQTKIPASEKEIINTVRQQSHVRVVSVPFENKLRNKNATYSDVYIYIYIYTSGLTHVYLYI